MNNTFIWGRGHARGRRDVDSIPLQFHNVASGWPLGMDMGRTQTVEVLCWIIITLRTIGNSAGEGSRICRKPVLELIILHPSLLCNVTITISPGWLKVTESWNGSIARKFKEALAKSPSFMGPEIQAKEG